jgi:3-hydroxyacyl-[acyl-carrier-protein] dehydratase
MSEQSPTNSPLIMPKPVDVLPHREPFLLVSEVLALEPGQTIHARWNLTGDEYFWPGHFPGRPTLPGVMMVEALARYSAALTASGFASRRFRAIR